MPVILVTGAPGFVGRWAVKALIERGFEVHGTSRVRGVSSSATLHHVDLHDAISSAALIDRVQPSHLLLCAWSTDHGVFWTDPANARWVASVVAAAKCFLTAGGRRIVLAGSCAEYNWSDPALGKKPISESMVLDTPQTLYGRAKREASEAIGALAQDSGATFAAGRIFFPMGWGESPQRFLPTVVNALLSDRPARLGSGRQIRDVIDVRDAGAALAGLAASEVRGAVNIGSGRGIALADVARLAANSRGRADLLQFGAIPARTGEPQYLVADVARLRDDVGFAPRYSIDETIDSSFEYWTRQKSVPGVVAGGTV